MALFGKKSKAKDRQPAPVKLEENQVVSETPATKLPEGQDARAYRVIVKPHLTEKGSRLQAFNQYTFRVNEFSNKFEIKRAIEKLYKVEVRKVAVLSMPAKERRLGRQIGQKPGFKKAIVTLQVGHKIDIA